MIGKSLGEGSHGSMFGNTVEVPDNVLYGRDRRYISVHRLFKAVYVQTFLAQLNKAYWDKTPTYGRDELGHSWEALKAVTHIRKWLKAEEYPKQSPQLTLTFKSPRQLNPKQLEEYKSQLTTINTTLEARQRRLIKARQERHALKEIYSPWWEKNNRSRDPGMSKGKYEDQNYTVPQTPKMVDTGRLVSATMPGPVVNNRHYNSKDLIVEVEDNKIYISLERIPYAKELDEGNPSQKLPARPIIPEDTSIWEERAYREGVRAAAVLFNTLLRGKPYRAREQSNTPF